MVLTSGFFSESFTSLVFTNEITRRKDREPMTIKKLSAGDIIEARCTKCREVLNHRIVAMVEGKVVRVECNTCNGVHNYHAPPSAKEAKAPRAASASKPRSTSANPRVPKKDPVEAEREEWASLSPTFNRRQSAPVRHEWPVPGQKPDSAPYIRAWHREGGHRPEQDAGSLSRTGSNCFAVCNKNWP